LAHRGILTRTEHRCRITLHGNRRRLRCCGCVRRMRSRQQIL
jgi:hypothetical protein